MAFEGAERNRFMEILKEEWDKGTGAVDVPLIAERMESEGFDAPRSEIGSFVMAFEFEGAAEVLAPDDAEKSLGNAVIRRLAVDR